MRNFENVDKIYQNNFQEINQEEINMDQGPPNGLPNVGVGVQVYMPSNYSKPLFIKENHFDSCHYGLVIAPESNPITDNPDPDNQAIHEMNIRITCNTFEGNEVGIIGSGNLRDQVHSDTAASNFFNVQNTLNSANYNWDILWQEDPNGNAFTYYYGSPNSYKPNTGNLLNENPITINGTSIGSTDHNPSFASIGICGTAARQKKASSDKSALEEQRGSLLASIYPNPTRNELNIEFNNKVQGNLKLQTLSGKTMVEKPIKEEAKVRLNTRNLSAGVYLVLIRIKGEIIPPKKSGDHEVSRK